MESFHRCRLAAHKAGDYLPLLGVLLLVKKHERAVYHAYILHAVAAPTQIKLAIDIRDIRDRMPHERLVGEYGTSRTYLAYHRHHPLGKSGAA